jgi:hypothetical protein
MAFHPQPTNQQLIEGYNPEQEIAFSSGMGGSQVRDMNEHHHQKQNFSWRYEIATQADDALLFLVVLIVAIT